MADVVILLGSNLGDRLGFLTQAVEALQENVGKLRKISSVYETAAWGLTDQNAFLNQVLELETELLPEQVLAQTQHIEKELGRVHIEKWGPRIIDLDLLFYDDLMQQNPALTLPHPQLHLRRFTLQPLAEVLPDLVHPVLRKSVYDLLQQCQDPLEVHLYHHGQLE